MTTEEWKSKIKAKIEHSAKTQQSFRELELSHDPLWKT